MLPPWLPHRGQATCRRPLRRSSPRRVHVLGGSPGRVRPVGSPFPTRFWVLWPLVGQAAGGGVWEPVARGWVFLLGGLGWVAGCGGPALRGGPRGPGVRLGCGPGFGGGAWAAGVAPPRVWAGWGGVGRRFPWLHFRIGAFPLALVTPARPSVFLWRDAVVQTPFTAGGSSADSSCGGKQQYRFFLRREAAVQIAPAADSSREDFSCGGQQQYLLQYLLQPLLQYLLWYASQYLSQHLW